MPVSYTHLDVYKRQGHSSAPTDPALMAELFLHNLVRWQAEEPLRGEVDFARGY